MCRKRGRGCGACHTMRPLAAVIAALILLPVAFASSVESYRYVTGTRLDESGIQASGACTSDLGAGVTIGGTCQIPVSGGETVRISVVDDVRGDVPYTLSFQADAPFIGTPTACANHIDAIGPTVVTIAPTCTVMSVFVDVGGLVGTITIEHP